MLPYHGAAGLARRRYLLNSESFPTRNFTKASCRHLNKIEDVRLSRSRGTYFATLKHIRCCFTWALSTARYDAFIHVHHASADECQTPRG